MAQILYGILAALPGIFWYLYYRLKEWRFKPFAHIPSQPPNSLLLGHLGLIGERYQKFGGPSVHPDYVFEDIWKENGCPDYIFLDTRPAQHPLALICSHELAEQISRTTKFQPYSTTKSITLQDLRPVIGNYSMISENGDSWKGFRKSFNPGFAPSHLTSLLPVIMNKTQIFLQRLDEIAVSGKSVKMEPIIINVTFDIMSEVVTNIDAKAQDPDVETDDIVSHFGALIETFYGKNGISFEWLNLPLQARRWYYSSKFDAAVKKCIGDKFSEIKEAQKTETKETKDRSVLALALRDVEELTPYIHQVIADQVKTFLFAGHDTTSVLISRLFYALSIHPHCLAKIRAEHDEVFGNSDPTEVFLAQPEETLKKLVYTSACIKEALRLWPPASSARMSHNGLKIKPSDGDEVCLDKCVLYINHAIIHRDPKIYGETANDFIPERWVGDVDINSRMEDADGTSAGASKIPISAWRAFERGPRNCIGQELANIEAKVILACTMRRYDFIKTGLGEAETDSKGQPIIDGKGKYKTKSELVNTMAITTKPIDKMVMKINLRQ